MAKKESSDSPANDEEQEIEERVRRMLDPSEPDEQPETAGVPKVISPGTAPEIGNDIPDKLPTKITIVDHNEDPNTAEKKTKSKKEAKTPPGSEDQAVTDKPKEIAVVDESEEAAVIETKQLEDEQVETDIEAEEQSIESTVKTKTETESSEATEDEETNEAVDDILAAESDELLEAEDEKIAEAFDDKKPGLKARIGSLLAAWWGNRMARRATISVMVIGIAGAATIPTSRYFLLNTFGVRSSASIIILDESTGLPLKNVRVEMHGQSALTDQEGRAVLERLKLGRTALHIEKRAFADSDRNITLGWGSNPLGESSLTPVGSQYHFKIVDYLSGNPLARIEASSGEASALSNDKGEIKLTMDVEDDARFEVVIRGNEFREEKQTLSADDKEMREVAMVASRKHVFITKRSGKYDVYKVDVDGKNESLVLAGSGNERDDMVLISHPTEEIAALVSTRDNVRNHDGYLLSTLTIINLGTNETVKVSQSERIQVVDWIGNRLIFLRIAAGTSAGNPQRHRLLSYEIENGQTTELATSNYFNDVMVVGAKVYYAPSSAYAPSPVAFYRINADGSNKQIILQEEVWNIFRTGYDHLTLATGQEWHQYNPAGTSTVKLPGEPANLQSRLYADNLEHSRSLWLDRRDGKGVLIVYDVKAKSDGNPPLKTESGLRPPVRWLNNSTVVYRVVTEQETADYALSINGGEAKKIRDVTNTADPEDWYYY